MEHTESPEFEHAVSQFLPMCITLEETFILEEVRILHFRHERSQEVLTRTGSQQAISPSSACMWFGGWLSTALWPWTSCVNLSSFAKWK